MRWAIALIALLVVGCSKGKTDADCQAEDWCSSHGHCTAVDDKCIAVADIDCTMSEVCKTQGKCVPKNGECIKDEVVADLRKLSKEQRVTFAERTGRDLNIPVLAAMNRLAAAVEDDAETAGLTSVFAAHRASALAEGISDMSDIVDLARVAGHARIQHIRTVPRTELREATKDSAANKGKWIEAAGTIQVIEKKADVFRGFMMTDDAKAVHFLTAGKTENLFADSKGTFVGICAGTLAGQVVLVGHFQGQGMD